MSKFFQIFAIAKRKFRRFFVLEPLAFCTRLIIKKRKVKIVGVTGSLGKTTTTNFVYKVLKTKFPRVFINTDLTTGVPTFLSIFNCKPSLVLNQQIIGMFLVFFKTIALLLNKNKEFHSHLVLELRCQYDGKSLMILTKKLKPDVRIITAIEIVHAKSLGDLSQIASRKRALVECACLSSNYAVLNYDDKYVREMSRCTVAKIIYFGFDDKANFKASDVKVDEHGLSLKLTAEGREMMLNVPKILDKVHVYAILSSIITGRIFGMSWDEVLKAASLIEPIEGRGNLVEGIKNTIIINNTFNANIRSMKAAIHSLESFSKDKRKVAILGDMLELHKFSDQCHREVGKTITAANVNFLITVGDDSKKIEEEAINNGIKKEDTRHYNNVEEALKEIKDLILDNDVILIKASHGINLDKIVHFLQVNK